MPILVYFMTIINTLIVEIIDQWERFGYHHWYSYGNAMSAGKFPSLSKILSYKLVTFVKHTSVLNDKILISISQNKPNNFKHINMANTSPTYYSRLKYTKL